jgi:hypothetical protein
MSDEEFAKEHPMTLRSFLAVDVRDGAAAESLLRAEIQEAGGVIERCDSRVASRGGREMIFTLQAVPVDVLHRIMRKVESVPGVSVKSVSQHART